MPSRKWASKAVLTVLGAIGFALLHVSTFGSTMAAVNRLRFWAFPAFFGIHIFLVALVMLPVGRMFHFDERRLESPFWRKIRAKGPFPLAFLGSFFFFPFGAALILRLLKVPERKAWVYAFFTTVINVILTVSFHLGAIGAVRAFLAAHLHR